MTAAQSDDLGISLSGPLTLKTIGALPPDIRALIAAKFANTYTRPVMA